ncbi:MAG: 30S ribosomal protein S5 [Chloroflexota bacterium]
MEPANKIVAADLALNDKLLHINRVAKVVKGGRRLRFSALMVSGDGNGHVGIGVGKANEVPLAINKAAAEARKNLIRVPLVGTTIPYEVNVGFGAAKVLIKPAALGTGIIAGSSVRAVLEAAGIKDVLAKSLGSSNRINMAKATILALSQLEDPAVQLARRLGKTVTEPSPPETGSAVEDVAFDG